jgi:hypothetical protein
MSKGNKHAQRVLQASNIKTGKLRGKKVAIAIIGQSNEQDNVAVSDLSAYPDAFASRYLPFGNVTPGRLSVAGYGGFWYRVADILYENGFNAKIVNHSVGSMSFVTDVVGQIKTRANNAAFNQRRAPEDSLDRGYFGDTTIQGGKVFVCTTGRKKYLSRRKDVISATSWNAVPIDYSLVVGSQVSAGSDPATWAAATLGSTITDGGITWTCVEAANSTNVTNGAVLNTAFGPYGFDPFGVIEKTWDELKRVEADQKLVYIANAQSDTGQSQSDYQTALENISKFFTLRGFKTLIGLSCYTPTSTTTAYNTLTAAQQAAIAAQAALYPGKVFAGANLYQDLGSTGVMGTGGAYLQGDNVHLNGAGVLASAPFIANRILTALNA